MYHLHLLLSNKKKLTDWKDKNFEMWFFFAGGCFADEHEARLMKFLMADYDAAVRPVENSSQPLTVIFGVSLHHIIDVVRKCVFFAVVKSFCISKVCPANQSSYVIADKHKYNIKY